MRHRRPSDWDLVSVERVACILAQRLRLPRIHVVEHAKIGRSDPLAEPHTVLRGIRSRPLARIGITTKSQTLTASSVTINEPGGPSSSTISWGADSRSASMAGPVFPENRDRRRWPRSLAPPGQQKQPSIEVQKQFTLMIRSQVKDCFLDFLYRPNGRPRTAIVSARPMR